MRQSQHYFSIINNHFLSAIYDSPKGAIRLAVLQRDLIAHLSQAPLRILDIGGGAGQMALWCASLGHEIHLIDNAAPLLESAKTAAEQADLSHRIHCIHADIFNLNAELTQNAFDVVLCHAVLEWIENGEKLIQIALSNLKANGLFSFMFYNRSALEFTHHVYGNFDYINNGLRAKRRAKLTPDYPRTLEWVRAEMANYPVLEQQMSGVRCFYDYMKPKDRAANSLEAIIAHELSLSRRQEFLAVARYLHGVWQKT